MDGAASPPASAEEDPSGGGAVDLDPRRPAAPAMIVPGEGQGYLDSLLRVSLQLLRKGYSPQVRHQGLNLMLHLLRFRWDELHFEEWSAGRQCLFVATDTGVAASAVNPSSVTNSTTKGNDGCFDDICDKIMDISFQRILQKSAATSPGSLELLSDELYGKNGFIQYRSVLLDLIRFIAYERPIITASRAVQRISYIIEDASAVLYPKDSANESAQLVLQTVVNTIFDDSAKIILGTEFPLQGLYEIFAGLLVHLLSLKWTEARLVVILQCYLNALCPFLKHFPDAVAMVLTKLLELLSSVNGCHDPSKAQSARLRICQCIIHICQTVDGPSIPSDMKDLFSVPHVTEEAVLAFVASKGTAYSVEQKLAGRQGNQDGDLPSASCTMPSPWVLNGENHDLPTTQPSFDSCSAPSLPKSNRTLSRKKLDHNPIPYPQLYRTSLPLLGSVPISWLRLGKKSKHRNKGKYLNLNPEYQISTESCCSSSLACSGYPCLALGKQRQRLHNDGELQTHVSSLMQVGLSQVLNIFDDCGQGNDQEQDTVQGIITGYFEGSSESVNEKQLGIMGTMSSPQENGYLLRVEHNILSEAFAILTSFPRIHDKEHLLADLLNTMNKIWTQSDWIDNYMYNIICVSDLFSDDEFRRTVELLVKSFEELTRNITVESAGDQEGSPASTLRMCSYALPKLMLPLILQENNYHQHFVPFRR